MYKLLFVIVDRHDRKLNVNKLVKIILVISPTKFNVFFVVIYIIICNY